MKYHTIIIGGGLAGLTAGATLAKFGKKVLLLEQHHKPGGCATTFKRGDFIIEVGLHEMSGLVENGKLRSIFKMLEVENHVELKQVPEFYGIPSDSEDFVFPHGFKAATKALINKYPDEEKGIRKFMKVLAGIRKEALNLPQEQQYLLVLANEPGVTNTETSRARIHGEMQRGRLFMRAASTLRGSMEI